MILELLLSHVICDPGFTQTYGFKFWAANLCTKTISPEDTNVSYVTINNHVFSYQYITQICDSSSENMTLSDKRSWTLLC